MKIRNGFVSNSSSSSFIVLFPIEPKSVEDVKNLLFEEGQELYLNPYYDEKWSKTKGYSVDKVAETVWKDIQDQEKNDIDEAINDMSNGYMDDAPGYSDFDYISDWQKSYGLLDFAKKKFAEKKIKKFLGINEEGYIEEEDVNHLTFYIFRYADEDGEYGSTLEHGGLFNNLKHIKISHH